jgi:hypothetical protein
VELEIGNLQYVMPSWEVAFHESLYGIQERRSTAERAVAAGKKYIDTVLAKRWNAQLGYAAYYI